jgi:GTPase involved in cell partitioning and DNA repair
MYSLLTEELNNYNNLGKNKKIHIIKNNNIDNNSDNNIDNNVDNNSDNNIDNKLVNSEYKNKKIENSLNIHIFNPLKNSPPSIWQFRLLNRINSLNDLESFNN